MTTDRNNAWLADIVLAFREVDDNGRAWLQDVYEWVRVNRKNRPKNFDSVIRATIYAHSTDSPVYVPGNPDVFRNVARGIWALRYPADQGVPKRSDDLRIFAFMQMTKEELEHYGGRGPELMAEVVRRAADIREKYKLGP